MGAAGAVAAGVEKEDKCELINGMWSLAFNGQTARANDSEIEEKIIEATIANWFEDEDASSDKVWEYFRVI